MKRTLAIARVVTVAGMMAWLAPWSGRVTQAQQSADRTPEEQRYFEHQARWFDLWQRQAIDQWHTVLAPEFICHCPNLNDGLESLTKYDGPGARQKPTLIPTVRVVDGNFILQQHFVLPLNPQRVQPDPADSSKLIARMGIELYRMRNNRQYEHWDHRVTLPDGIIPVHPDVTARSAAETRNLEFILNYWNNVYLPLKVEQFKEYYTADYIEHDPMVSMNSLNGLVTRLTAEKAKSPDGLPPVHLLTTLVDGDVVALYRVDYVEPRAPTPAVPTARTPPASRPALAAWMSLEIFRVRNGKIVEHWGEWGRPPASSTVAPH